jgi:diguanylate cyclase (GGDEF)-like protein
MAKIKRKSWFPLQFTLRRAMVRINNFLSRLSRRQLVLLVIGLLFGIGLVDHVTGSEVSIGLFYLIPIGVAAWYLGRPVGTLVSIVGAAIWFVVNGPALPVPEFPFFVLLSNTAMRLGFFIVVAVLFSVLHRAIDRERELARTDFLTGVRNARSFYEQAEIELNRIQRHHRPFSIAYFDVDNFKELNDRFGHEAGDGALHTIGIGLVRCLRPSDVIGRLGGDEFAILLPETGKKKSIAVTKRIRAVLGKKLRYKGWPLTLSMGVVTCATAPPKIAPLMKEVDALMYEVKRSGKNRVKHRTMSCDAAPAQR